MKRPILILLCLALFLFSPAASCKPRRTTDAASGEPSRNVSRSDYYDPATAGPGYPGRTDFRVFLVKDDITSPPPSRLSFPSRWEACRDAVEMFRAPLAERGKRLVYVDSPETADCVLPQWGDCHPGVDAWTAPAGAPDAGTVHFCSGSYDRLSDKQLSANAAHEVLHVLGVGKHSDDVRDVGHPRSRASRLTDRDLDTLRKVLKP